MAARAAGVPENVLAELGADLNGDVNGKSFLRRFRDNVAHNGHGHLRDVEPATFNYQWSLEGHGRDGYLIRVHVPGQEDAGRGYIPEEEQNKSPAMTFYFGRDE